MKVLSDDALSFFTAMRNAVIEKGQGYVYDQTEGFGDGSPISRDEFLKDQGVCSYINYRDGGTQGSCIVGRGLLDSGLMDLNTLSGFESISASKVVPWDESGDFATAATMMQARQDGGLTWAASYNFGIGYLKGRGWDVEDLTLDGHNFS